MAETYHAMSHFILYAKGWYLRGELEDDIKILMENYTGISREHISKQDIFSVLNDFAYDVIQKSGNPKNQFFRYIADVEQYGFISAALKLFNVMKVTDLNLDSPNSEILPLNHE